MILKIVPIVSSRQERYNSLHNPNTRKPFLIARNDSLLPTHRIHVWYIYLHVPKKLN